MTLTSLYREIEALGGATIIDDYDEGYTDGLEDALKVLRKHGFGLDMAPGPSLKWSRFERFLTARTPFDTVVYGVGPWYELSGEWTVRLNGKEIGRAPNEAGAKSLAQEDFVRRIRSSFMETTCPNQS
ncbi:hypothetical protein B5M44_03965 [Shinella sumterensis]|uniref:hypothetical protein n=1 Tax=Shinella sumterensis TaxID=1967501 RepID=UPI00106DEB90|nr:hypothetical protein [Shinella sumterensis]MCD1264100.1 hypothetical protein [Shinella sumterensis]TFE99370.1 hypothetical protein B5M44_03965 [Shinella sumterensis]